MIKETHFEDVRGTASTTERVKNGFDPTYACEAYVSGRERFMDQPRHTNGGLPARETELARKPDGEVAWR